MRSMHDSTPARDDSAGPLPVSAENESELLDPIEQLESDARSAVPANRDGGLHQLKPREQRTRKDELRYFTVAVVCRGCGIKARIKVDKLHRTLQCRQCGMVMHLDHNGTWLPGPPPKTEEHSEADGGARGIVVRWSGRLLRRVPVLKSRNLLIGLALVLVAGISYWAYNRYAESQIDIPHTMQGRSVVICQMVIDGEPSHLHRVVDPATKRESREWFDKVEDRVSRAIVSSDMKPFFRCTVLFDNRNGLGCVIARFKVRSRNDATGAPSTTQLLECVLYFTKGPDGAYYLDGKRTLAALR